MTDDATIIIQRAYTEASLAAKEKGLSGLRASRAVMDATVKISSRVLNRVISAQDVETVIHGGR